MQNNNSDNSIGGPDSLKVSFPGSEVRNSGGASCRGVIWLPTELPDNHESGNSCTLCGKCFRRKTSFETHLQSCRNKGTIKKQNEDGAGNVPALFSKLDVPEENEDFEEVLTQFCNQTEIGEKPILKGDTTKLLICVICNRKFKSKSGLSTHKKFCKQKVLVDRQAFPSDISEMSFSALAKDILAGNGSNIIEKEGLVPRRLDKVDVSLDVTDEVAFCSITSTGILKELGKKAHPPSPKLCPVRDRNMETNSISSEDIIMALGERKYLPDGVLDDSSDVECNSLSSTGETFVRTSKDNNLFYDGIDNEVNDVSQLGDTSLSQSYISRSVDNLNKTPSDVRPGKPNLLESCDLSGDLIHSNSPSNVIKDKGKNSSHCEELRDFSIIIEEGVCFPIKNKYGQIVQGSQCKVCLKVFTSQRQLLVHHREKPECSGYELQCKGCDSKFRNEQGLKQHVSRSDCGNASLGLQSNSTTGVPLARQDINHVQKAHSSQPQVSVEKEKQILKNLPSKPEIRWPRMSDNKQWKRFEDGVMKQLDKSGGVQASINNLVTVIQEEATALFGVNKVPNGGRPPLLRREKKLIDIGRQIKKLTRLSANADTDEERGGLLLVRSELIEKKRSLRKAENSRKARWRRKKAKQTFYSDPYKACREVLMGSNKARLRVSKDVMDEFVSKVASDPLKKVDLGPLEGLPPARDPEIPFDTSKFKFGIFKKILKRTRNASRPGPNGIPYKVYKKCPKLASYLFSLHVGVLKSKRIPLQWRISDGIFIPKVDKANEKDIHDFRQIALMNVEGKLFWSLVSDRLYGYLVEDNKYIKTNAQKGSIRNMAGCWEHTSMVWSALKDAKSSLKPLAILWLDLANAYGSVPHKLIAEALKRYKVPQEWIDLILEYYDGLWGRSNAGDVKSEWTRYEKGVFAGCTISVILFLLAFNLIIEFVQAGPMEKYILNGKPIEAIRGFMDDISILVTSVPMARVALCRTQTALTWARMSLKPPKSRSIVVKRGKVQDVQPFSVEGKVIPGLHKKPLRTLGRFYDFSLNDHNSKLRVFNHFCNSLIKLDKSSLTGFMKAWGLHHILIPQVEWDFMMYEISISWIEAMERKQNVYTRKWLGVAKHLSKVALYSSGVPCPLPFKSLLNLFKKTKVRSYLQLSYSQDEQVSSSVRYHNTGTKWKTAEAVSEAQSRVNQKRIIGEVRGVHRTNDKGDCSRRAGLGLGTSSTKTPDVGSKEARQELVNTLDDKYEEELQAAATKMALQGAWMNWKGFIQRDLTWKSVLFGRSELVKFCIGATYETLATPSNLKQWNFVKESSCSLCSEPDCNIRHILSSCSVALFQGRYLWRHNNVLRVIADGIQSFLQNNKVVSKGVKQIHFVRETGKAKEKRGRKPDLGILHRASDFVLNADLDKQLKYPEHIADSGSRPDIVLYSNSLRLVVHLELTCPIEENFDFAHNRKENTYNSSSDLGILCKKNGWQVICLPVEVGARGYAGQSLMACVRKLGLGKQRSRTVVKKAADEALRSSFWIWILRARHNWKLSTGFKPNVAGENSTKDVDGGRAPVRNRQRTKQRISHVPKIQTKLPPQKFSNGSDQVKGKKVPLIPKTPPNSWVPKDLKKSKKASLSHQVKMSVPSKVPPFSDIPFRGLINPGNTCYANCIIQAISPLVDSRCYVVFGIAKEFLSLCSVLSQKDKAIAPTKFLKEFREKNPVFIEGKQHDASAFLTSLLLHIPYSILEDDLTVESRSAWTCKHCGKGKSYSEPTSVLQLPYAAGNLTGMVEKYCKPSLVKSFPCSSCSAKGHVMKHEEIANSPKFLILAVKKPLGSNETISIKNPLSPLQFKQLQYQLLSVIIHSGQDNAGHYVTIRKHKQQWLLFDDDKVAEIQTSTAETLAQSGYMFVFCS